MPDTDQRSFTDDLNPQSAVDAQRRQRIPPTGGSGTAPVGTVIEHMQDNPVLYPRFSLDPVPPKVSVALKVIEIAGDSRTELARAAVQVLTDYLKGE